MAPELAQGKGYNLSNDVWAMVSTDRQTGADSCTMCIWLYGRVLQGCVLAETMCI